MGIAYLRSADHTSVRTGGRCRLAAGDPVVKILIHIFITHHVVGGDEITAGRKIRCLHSEVIQGKHFPEGFILQRGFGDDSQIPGSGILLRVFQAVNICKIGICAAKFPGLFIHLYHKFLLRTCNVRCHDCSRIVGRGHHYAKQQISQGNLLTSHQSGRHRAPGNGIQRTAIDRDQVIKISLFDDDQGSQQFHHTGGVDPLIRIPGIEQGITVQFISNHRLRRIQQLFRAGQRYLCVEAMAAGSYGLVDFPGSSRNRYAKHK